MEKEIKKLVQINTANHENKTIIKQSSYKNFYNQGNITTDKG